MSKESLHRPEHAATSNDLFLPTSKKWRRCRGLASSIKASFVAIRGLLQLSVLWFVGNRRELIVLITC